jgi:hypothetical protein
MRVSPRRYFQSTRINTTVARKSEIPSAGFYEKESSDFGFLNDMRTAI